MNSHLAKFQYPLRVEVGCSCGNNPGDIRSKEFQYPLRVEVGCSWHDNHHSARCRGFSTLYGSKWVADAQEPKAAL